VLSVNLATIEGKRANSMVPFVPLMCCQMTNLKSSIVVSHQPAILLRHKDENSGKDLDITIGICCHQFSSRQLL
jgi:hypothetical protein